MDTNTIIRDFDRIATIADQYDSGSDRYDHILCALVPAQARSIADIGCGLGRLSIKLAERNCPVMGIDLSPEMIARAKKNAGDKSNISFICGDFLADERLDCMFDCVVTAATLHHVDMETGVRRLMDLVHDGGRLIIHDLRDNTTAFEEVKSLISLAQTGLLRFVRTGNPFRSHTVRRAWDEHGAREKYLTISEARKMAETYLPGAQVFAHWGWRYTVVWDKYSIA
jgi:2-polyprenyl-3-methyl-5-hydroxy-6-metoxy-1,4-benzoquinol methylase